MEKKKMNIIAGMVVAAFMAAFIIYTNVEGPKETKKEYEKFNAANINGILDEDAGASAGAAYFTVNSEKYMIWSYTSKTLNQNKDLNEVGEKGDSIIKPPYAEILTLKKKDGTIYKYTFSKF